LTAELSACLVFFLGNSPQKNGAHTTGIIAEQKREGATKKRRRRGDERETTVAVDPVLKPKTQTAKQERAAQRNKDEVPERERGGRERHRESTESREGRGGCAHFFMHFFAPRT